MKPVNSKGSEGHADLKFSCEGGKDWLVGLPTHPAAPVSSQAHPHQGAFQVEGLCVLAQQHDVLLQVVEAAVLVVADTLLRMAGQVTLLQDPTSCLGTPGLEVPLPNKVTAKSLGSSAQTWKLRPTEHKSHMHDRPEL